MIRGVQRLGYLGSIWSCSAHCWWPCATSTHGGYDRLVLLLFFYCCSTNVGSAQLGFKWSQSYGDITMPQPRPGKNGHLPNSTLFPLQCTTFDHYGPYELWSKVVHYIGNRVPFWSKVVHYIGNRVPFWSKVVHYIWNRVPFGTGPCILEESHNCFHE